MRKLLMLVLILVVLGGVFYAFLYVNQIKLSDLRVNDISVANVENISNLRHLSGSAMAAKRALDMWDKGEMERLYRNLATDIQQVLPKESFAHSRDPMLVAGALRPQIIEVKEQGDTATVTATVVDLNLKAITAEIFGGEEKGATKGSKRRKILIELKKEREAWRIAQFEPVTRAFQVMDTAAKAKKVKQLAKSVADSYRSQVAITNLRAQVIHRYGKEPFIVGLVENKGERKITKLGIRFTLTFQGKKYSDIYYPVVQASISNEEQPLGAGGSRKISYQLDREIEGFDSSHMLSAEITDLILAPPGSDADADPAEMLHEAAERSKVVERK